VSLQYVSGTAYIRRTAAGTSVRYISQWYAHMAAGGETIQGWARLSLWPYANSLPAGCCADTGTAADKRSAAGTAPGKRNIKRHLPQFSPHAYFSCASLRRCRLYHRHLIIPFGVKRMGRRDVGVITPWRHSRCLFVVAGLTRCRRHRGLGGETLGCRTSTLFLPAYVPYGKISGRSVQPPLLQNSTQRLPTDTHLHYSVPRREGTSTHTLTAYLHLRGTWCAFRPTVAPPYERAACGRASLFRRYLTCACDSCPLLIG